MRLSLLILFAGGLILKFLYARLPVQYTFDEGIYWQDLTLMAQGLVPYRDFFHAQFPAFLRISNFFYSLSGGSLGLTRFALAALSSTSIFSAWVIGKNLHSPKLGWAFALLLGVDSLFFHLSYHLNGDALALSFFMASLALAGYGYRKRDARNPLLIWTGSAMLGALSLMVKPITAPLFVLYLFFFPPLRRTARWRNALAFAAAGALSVLALLFAFGWFKYGVQQLQGGSFWESHPHMAIGMTFRERALHILESPSSYPIGNLLVFPSWILAFVVLFRKRRFSGIPAATLTALVAAILALFFHQNVNWYHFVILAPLTAMPVAYLAVEDARFRKLFWVLVATHLVFDVAPLFVPAPGVDEVNEKRAMLIETIRRSSSEGDLVISDDAFAVAAAGRRPSPSLVDLSWARVRSGSITCRQIERVMDTERPRLFVMTKPLRQIDCGEEGLKHIVQTRLPKIVLERKNLEVFGRS